MRIKAHGLSCIICLFLCAALPAFGQGVVTEAPLQPTDGLQETIPVPAGAGLASTDTNVDSSANADLQVAEPAPLGALARATKFLRDGGPAIWAIAALSVVTLALILWKIWRLALMGALSRGRAVLAVDAYEQGDLAQARQLVEGRRGLRARVMATTLTALGQRDPEQARAETLRVAKRELAHARAGLGALELISTIAPLLGLLGTVLGMIAAFQALQAAGSRADPALLAGGIWEALLTTAAGMAVAIPASAALTWFESVIDRMRRDIEDNAARVFLADPVQAPAAQAAQ